MSEQVVQTGGYMVAAYIITAVILVTYTVLLARRVGKKHN
jgi:hypothetical protein